VTRMEQGQLEDDECDRVDRGMNYAMAEREMVRGNRGLARQNLAKGEAADRIARVRPGSFRFLNVRLKEPS